MLRSLNFICRSGWIVILAAILLVIVEMYAPVRAHTADSQIGIWIPEGYVVVLSFYSMKTKTGIVQEAAYHLGMVVDDRDILTVQGAIISPDPRYLAPLAGRILAMSNGAQMRELEQYTRIQRQALLQLEAGAEAYKIKIPAIARGYTPESGELLSGFMLVSREGRPLKVQKVALEVKAAASLEDLTVYQLKLETRIDGIINGFLFNENGEFVGMLITHKKALLLLPVPTFNQLRGD